MIGRAHPILWRVLGAVLTVLLIGMAGLVWRLGQGPIDVSFLTPLLEEQMADAPVRLRIGETALAWEGSDRPLSMALSDVRLIDPVDGQPVATLPYVLVSVSGPALLSGRIVPTRMSFDDLDLRLQIDPLGNLDLGLAAVAPDAVPPETLPLPAIDDHRPAVTEPAADPASERAGPDPSGSPVELSAAAPEPDAVSQLLRALATPADVDPAGMAALSQIDVRNASLTVFDGQTGREWQVRRLDASVERSGAIVTGSARAEVMLGDTGVPVEIVGTADPAAGTGTARARLVNLNPAALAAQEPRLADLAGLDLPIALEAEADFTGTALPDWVHVEATVGTGEVTIPQLYTRPLAVARGRAGIDIDLLLRTVTVDALEVDFGGPRITATATLTEAGDLIDVVADGRVTDLPVDLLDRYWPDQLTGGGRRWITANINRGSVEEAAAGVHLQIPRDGAAAAEPRVLDLTGHIDFVGATLNVLGQPRDGIAEEDWFPLITGIDGRATFTADEFRVTTRSGQLAGIAVPESDILIDGFDADVERIEIDTVVSGPVPNILSVLDREPLGFVRRLGIAPDQAQGDAAGRLRFAFPLTRDLTFDDVRLAAAANLMDGALPDLLDRIALTDLDGAMTLDGSGLTLTGTGAANGVPASFTWVEPFSGPGGTVIEADAVLDDADRAALAVIPEVGDLAGPVAARMVYRSAEDSIAITADLAEAEAALPELNWRKPAGLPGTLALTLRLEEGEVRRIDPLEIATEALTANGRLTLTEAGDDIARLEVDRLRFAGTDARIVAVRGPLGLDMTVTGQSLDLVTLFNDPLGRRVEDWSLEDRRDRLARQVDTPTAGPAETPSVGAGSAAAAPEDPPGPPIAATVALDRVRVLPDTIVTDVSGTVGIVDGSVVTLDIAAALESGAPFDVRQAPEGSGEAVLLQITAEDAGALIAGLGITDSLRGGTVVLDGRRETPDAPIVGTVTLDDLLLVDAPIMARVLAAVSLVGLADAANTEGLRFTRVQSGFRLDDGLIEISDGLASGSSLGISADGAVDLDADLIDIRGTIVPVAGVNRVIGAIPLLGTLLTGGDDGGLIGFTYAMNGDLADPDIGVNPLSALAPGFLRRLFFEQGNPGAALSERREEGASAAN